MRRTATIVIGALILAGCGGEGGNGTTKPVPGAGEALIRLESTGGFVPLDWLFGRGPTYTLNADGVLIFEGPVLAIFPGPLLPNYRTTRLSQGEMRQIRRMIDRMGLPEMVDEVDDTNIDHVADATTEVITYWDGEGLHRYSAYAPGTTMGPVPAATRVFEDLRGVLDSLAFSRDSDPYEPERIRVIAGEGGVDRDFSDVRGWPLADTDLAQWADLDNGWRCKAFDSDILDSLVDATQATVWRNPNPDESPAELKLLVRPLHPGEADCPTLP